MSLLAPPQGAGTAVDNAAWWRSLSAPEQDRVILEHPEWIGNRDGVDFTARDRANRILLPRYRADLQGQKADLEAALAVLDPNDPDYDPQGRRLGAQLDQINDKLASLDTVTTILTRPDRHLLGLDLSPGLDRAQAVVSVGDVTTADHVSVFTPGLTSTVQGLKGYDRDMDNLRKQAEWVLGKKGSTDTVATVTWLGYQAPQFDTIASGNSVALPGAAQDGGRNLAEFYRGLNASRTTEVDLTALGHSYGSTTTGYALQQDTGVDRAGFFGSPGLSVDRIEDLQVSSGQSFYAEAKWDGVGDLARFGEDPSGMAGVRHLQTGAATDQDGGPLAEVTGHTSYLQDRSTSQYNLATLVAGHPEAAISGNNLGYTDSPTRWLRWTVP